MSEKNGQGGGTETEATAYRGYKRGDAVRLLVPENPRLHMTLARIKSLAPEGWGAFVAAPAAAPAPDGGCGEFRALWEEMRPVVAVPGEEDAVEWPQPQTVELYRGNPAHDPATARPPATPGEYTGYECENCRSMRVRRVGTCMRCDDCFANTGCS